MDDTIARHSGTTSLHPTVRRPLLVLPVVLLAAALTGVVHQADAAATQTVHVEGTGVHYFATAIVHAQDPTDTGIVQRSSDIVELDGDLTGYLLYHATSTFDLDEGTLVNTGTQCFSGTIHGSEPVILHDDRFRFEVDLATGATVGQVHLGRSKDAPHPGHWYECHLQVIGTGLTPAGDGTVDYSGECTSRGR